MPFDGILNAQMKCNCCRFATATTSYIARKGEQLQKDSGTIVGNGSQCKNFRIFLSFRFYVKSTLENLDVLKLPGVFWHFIKIRSHLTV